MKIFARLLKRDNFSSLSVLTVAVLLASNIFLVIPANAYTLVSNRSLSLESSADGNTAGSGTAGNGTDGAKTGYTVTFTAPASAETYGSVALIFCTNPLPQTSCTDGTATTGTEKNLTTGTITGSSGTLGGTGWAYDSATTDPTITNYGTCDNTGGGTVRNNCVLFKATSPAANTGTPVITMTFGGASGSYVVNPTNDNQTFYVRIVVFSDNGYATPIDFGGAAGSTAQQLTVTAKVQEQLNFSVGSTYGAPGTTCATLTGANVTLGDSSGTLSTTQAYTANSYYRLYTNALNGVNVLYSGDTLKSGANSISAIGATATASSPGTSQFGISYDNGDANQSLNANFTETTAYNGSQPVAHPTTWAYNTGSLSSPITIGSEATGHTISCDTGSISYVGNISTTTPPGIYTTAISYIATPTF